MVSPYPCGRLLDGDSALPRKRILSSIAQNNFRHDGSLVYPSPSRKQESSNYGFAMPVKALARGDRSDVLIRRATAIIGHHPLLDRNAMRCVPDETSKFIVGIAAPESFRYQKCLGERDAIPIGPTRSAFANDIRGGCRIYPEIGLPGITQASKPPRWAPRNPSTSTYETTHMVTSDPPLLP
jgi:hypothetical protein